MSIDRDPVISVTDNLEFIVAEYKTLIIDEFCDAVIAGKPLKDKNLERRYPSFDSYFGFLTALLTNSAPTVETTAITSRSFHFGYYLSSQLMRNTGLLLRGYYNEARPQVLADRIVEDSTSYLAMRPNIDSVVLAFMPELTDGMEERSSLARTAAGLALVHVEQHQRYLIREEQITAQVAELFAELDTFDGL